MATMPRSRRFRIALGYGLLSAVLVPFSYAVAHGSPLLVVPFIALLAPAFLFGVVFGFGSDWPMIATCLVVAVIQFIAAYGVLALIGFVRRDIERTR
ncbi:MAG TPA: hypothetical protein VF816_03675 [Rhodocyclaceae bacterium]